MGNVYCISDIHNDNIKFHEILQKIDFSGKDHLYILGDLFDRSSYNPDPVGVYFTMLQLDKQCTVIRGNHDHWLAKYILKYYHMPQRKREKMEPYPYNSFQILADRLTSVDMQNLAEMILSWPLQKNIEVEGERYLLAHAMTSAPEIQEASHYYLMGQDLDEEYLKKGIDGYISVCGHRNIDSNHIWKNDIGNVYMCDCGCGFKNGKLGCLCLETKEEFYV